MTQIKNGTTLIVRTKSRTFRAKAARTFSTHFDMIYPVLDLDRGAALALVWSNVESIKVEEKQ